METSPDHYIRDIDRAHPLPEVFDVENTWEVLDTKDRILQEEVTGRKIGGAYIGDNVSIIGECVHIESTATIKPSTVVEAEPDRPVYISEECTVGPHAYVRPGTVLGRGATVGRTEVKNSILLEEATAAHGNYIGDSVIAEDVNIGSGVDIANLRHDETSVEVEGRDTGRRKMGCIAGHSARLGIDNTIYQGTHIGPGAWTRPGATLEGFVPGKQD